MALMQKKIQIRSHFQKFIEAPIRAPKISRNMSDSRSFFFSLVCLELDNLMTREKSFSFQLLQIVFTKKNSRSIITNTR